MATKEANSTIKTFFGLCIMNLWDKFTFAYLCNDSARNSTTMLRKESTVPLCGIIININKNSRKYHYIFWTYHLYSISEAKLYLLFIKNTMQFTPTHRCLWGAYGLFWMCVYAFRWEILRFFFVFKIGLMALQLSIYIDKIYISDSLISYRIISIMFYVSNR